MNQQRTASKAGALPLSYTPIEMDVRAGFSPASFGFADRRMNALPPHEILEPEDWNRTVDILFTRQALSQLSYKGKGGSGGGDRTRASPAYEAGALPLGYTTTNTKAGQSHEPANAGTGLFVRPAETGPAGRIRTLAERFRRSPGTPRRGGMVGRARVELASLAGSSGLSRGRLPIAPPSVGARPRTRTGKRQGLSLAGMPDSRQPRISGAFPGIRTRNIWSLKPARLPVAPDQEPSATQDSRRLVLSAAKDCVKRNKCFDWCRSPASNREAPASKAGRYAHSLQIG